MGLAIRLLVLVLVWLWYGASLLLLSMLGGLGYRAMGDRGEGRNAKEISNANGFSMVNGLCII